MSPRKKPPRLYDDVAEVEEEVPVEEPPQDAEEVPKAEEAPVGAQVEEEATSKQEDEPPPVEETAPASVKLQYLGDADVLQCKSFRFRPGEAVEVPADVAEELLTYPFERFKVKE